MKTGKIISGIMLAIAYISLIVAGFTDGLQIGLARLVFALVGLLVALLIVSLIIFFEDEENNNNKKTNNTWKKTRL